MRLGAIKFNFHLSINFILGNFFQFLKFLLIFRIPVILFGIMFGLPLLLTFRLTRKIDIKEMVRIENK